MVAPAPDTALAPAGPRASCRSSAPASHPPLSHPGPTIEIDGRSFALAWQGVGAEVQTVIVGLDERGALVTTPIPIAYADPVALGGDASGLVLVSVAQRGGGTLLQVDLGPDGALRPGTPRSLPDIALGWPGAIGVAGGQAIVEHSLASPDRSISTTALYTIDLATARVTRTSDAGGRKQVHCHAGACTIVDVAASTTDAPARASIVRGAEHRELELTSACPNFYPLIRDDALLLVAPGAPWRAVEVTAKAPFLRELAIDPSLAGEAGCHSLLHVFPSATRPGLVADEAGARTLLRWDPSSSSFGAPESLPAPSGPRSLRASHPDGVIEVGWTGGHGMIHTPTDSQGRRRYYKQWHFDGGQIALLRHEAGGWTSVDPTPLALGPREGTFHDGYTPVVLRHGLHAGVLLAPDGGGDEAWFQPYLAPCP
ncbi:hypothetical protein [Nannocystis sp. SCPEA4]|uniref:hypothetical protein n=1 Tax=Nannocystis sp. SCPEA4 TaxID=2996787 RepID=UPI00226F4258|nr:hypothetical protein [Nannocystis sp. SCPEA4]MCY1054649.1 hypothetical protein [Nannocystis sp. SCPEA4]